MKIRASIGTAAVLGLEKILIQAKPTTAYLMMFSDTHCLSNCSFCPQAKESSGSSEKLSRVLWPVYDLNKIIENLKTKDSGIKRICIQTIRFQNSDDELLEIIKRINEHKLTMPLTVCCYPTNKETFIEMKKNGVKRIGISFDCATPELYEQIKGKKRGIDISWETMERAMQEAIEVFGKRFVSTHLIIGLGESEKEAVQFIQNSFDRNITVGLFALTPIKGTALEKYPQPRIDSYRRIQLARYLIYKEKSSFSHMVFKNDEEQIDRIIDFNVGKEELNKIISAGNPFKTTGCSHCNRPFYNESPGKELYNYPVDLIESNLTLVKKSLLEFL